MEFGPIPLDDATIAFWREVRSFLDEHVTAAVVEEEWQTGAGLNIDLHRALGERGWLDPALPPHQGGIGATEIELTILDRELRAHDAPMVTHMSSMLVASSIRNHGSDALKREILPKLANGEVLISLGYTEPDAGSDLASLTTRAVRDGDEWIVTGQKMFTTSAQNCQFCFVATRTNTDAPLHRGITMFLVPTPDPRIEIRPVHTLGGERTNTVFFDAVRVNDRLRVGPVDQGWLVLNGPKGALSSEHGAGGERIDGSTLNWKALSVLRRALDSSVDWARTPRADGTRPIDDQTVRRRLARVAVDLEVAEVAPPVLSRVITTAVLERGARDLANALGPEGLVDVGEDAPGGGWVQHAYRFAPGTAIYGGTIDIFRNLIAEKQLGLPRSRPPRTQSH